MRGMEERKDPGADLAKLITDLDPELLSGRYVFVQLPEGSAGEADVLASVREPEGLSVVLRQEDADRLGVAYGFVAAWITLRVESALDAIGLTAAVSAALAEEAISCNVIAGLRHDHLLVPVDEGPRVLSILRAME
jgi:uncharacterized protein